MTYSNTDTLRGVLYDRSTLYSGNEQVRIDLIERTMQAVSHINLGVDIDPEAALFNLMDQIATGQIVE